MYKNTDKQKLYWLIDEYLSNKINAVTFCDEFYYCFDLAIDMSVLTDQERSLFLELSDVVGRFSAYKEDFENHPGVYYSELDLNEKIVETKNRLMPT